MKKYTPLYFRGVYFCLLQHVVSEKPDLDCDMNHRIRQKSTDREQVKYGILQEITSIKRNEKLEKQEK